MKIPQRKVDVIVVGQGIAGTALAYTLIKGHKKILVVDNYQQQSASGIAPGIFNPVVFRRYTITWKASVVVPFTDKFYRELEQFTSQSFFHKVPIYKVLSSPEECKLWREKAKEPGTDEFMEEEISSPPEEWKINAQEGGYIKHGGYLETGTMLKAFRNFLAQNDMLVSAPFDHKELEIQAGSVQWKNITAEKIIFCEGYAASKNPYFQWLPFKHTKGEVLTIEAPDLSLDSIVNKNMFVLPGSEGTYRVGSTFDWENLDTEVTEQAKNELCSKLEKLIKVPYTVTDHQAGIRPTVKDRRPLIGFHPEYPEIGVFNGLGTKGVMLAPYFADHFFQFMQGGIPSIEKEADIRRFWKLVERK